MPIESEEVPEVAAAEVADASEEDEAVGSGVALGSESAEVGTAAVEVSSVYSKGEVRFELALP